MVSKSHAPTKKAPASKSKSTAAAKIKTKAPVKAKMKSVSELKMPKASSKPAKNPSAYHFHVPLPNGFHTKLLETQAEHATGERAIKLRVMASLYSGHDYNQAAEENKVPLGNVYLWLADFRKGGLAAL
ncbi:helix-turn-helix domain-containing protein [Rhizobium sp. BK176]|uniref:helix-turn-helix domain-containing protein n=1 Tax=Rhizobium sp. BK176 TaxID=2587071 RepID=UPI002166D756|nr:helix-turn-helix domain-containing protein [Rhizobium sp. BK176]MCS4089922.1 hypothetical protein [Rhizobium sp. BK176]